MRTSFRTFLNLILLHHAYSASMLPARQSTPSPPSPQHPSDHWWDWTCAPQQLLSNFKKRTQCISQAEKAPCPAYPKGLPGYNICLDTCWRGNWDAVRAHLFVQYLGDVSDSSKAVNGSYTVCWQDIGEGNEEAEGGGVSVAQERCDAESQDEYQYTAEGYAGGSGPYVFEYDRPSVEIEGPWKDFEKLFEGTRIGWIRIQAQVEGEAVQTAVMGNPWLEA